MVTPEQLAVEVCHDLINRAMRNEAEEVPDLAHTKLCRDKEAAIRTLLAEVHRLRAEVESLAPHARDSETEPDAEVLTSPHRCDCCSAVIEPGESAVMFSDEAGRECWAHYGVCPEPEMWCVEWQLNKPKLRSEAGQWIRMRWLGGLEMAEPYEDALTMARARAASGHTSRVRLVRCKGPRRG